MMIYDLDSWSTKCLVLDLLAPGTAKRVTVVATGRAQPLFV